LKIGNIFSGEGGPFPTLLHRAPGYSTYLLLSVNSHSAKKKKKRFYFCVTTIKWWWWRWWTNFFYGCLKSYSKQNDAAAAGKARSPMVAWGDAISLLLLF